MNKVKWPGKSLQHPENSGSAHSHAHHGWSGKPVGRGTRRRHFAFQYPVPCLKQPVVLRVIFNGVLRRVEIPEPVSVLEVPVSYQVNLKAAWIFTYSKNMDFRSLPKAAFDKSNTLLDCRLRTPQSSTGMPEEIQ